MKGAASFLICLLLFAEAISGAGQSALAEAMEAYRHGLFQRSVDLLSGKAGSNEPDVHLWLGKSYLKTRKWDDAVREMEKAAQLDPSNSTYHLWLGRACGAKASHATFLTAFGWARKVVRQFETAVRLDPRNLDARFDLLEFYLEAPGIVGGGRDKAEAEARQIAAINPRQGITARARISRQDRNWGQARRELTSATLQYPDDEGAFLDAAEFLLSRSEYADAEANARKALRLNPENKRAKFLMDAAMVGLGRDLPDAEKSLASLTAVPLRDEDPAFEELYYWLGRALQEQGKAAEARQAYQTALRFDPEYDAAKSALSRTH
jgi:tetratricopeptide (TPR) repeat protein